MTSNTEFPVEVLAIDNLPVGTEVTGAEKVGAKLSGAEKAKALMAKTAFVDGMIQMHTSCF